MRSMQKTLYVLICLLFVMTVLFPVGAVVSDFFGYHFVLTSVEGFSAFTAVLSFVTVILGYIFNISPKSRTVSVLSVLITPLSFVNSLFLMISVFDNATPLIFLCIIVLVGCSLILTAKYGRPMVMKIISLILSVLLIFPLLCMSFFVFVLGPFGQDTVVDTIDSPNGKYTAQIIASSQGALGGDTVVNVCHGKKNVFDLLIFRIEEKTRRVYIGNWGEFNNMDIYWEDDHTLFINSVEYIIE